MRPLYREFCVQSELDAQYNPSIALLDPNAPICHYEATAQQARHQLGCVLNVSYGPTLEETLDIFPAAQVNAPVFVFIHGGYWRARSSKTFSGVALGPQAAGITTVVINYALCPHVTIDEIVRQIRSALAWTLRNIQHHGGDPARVSIGGHSAGGHLTAMALQTAWSDDYGLPQDPFVAAILLSGLFDIEPLRYSYLQPAIQLDDGIILRNSPAFTVRPCKTPLWITWGGVETTELARQSRIYHEAWQAAGNVSELRALPGANHFTIISGFEDAQSELCTWLIKKLN